MTTTWIFLPLLLLLIAAPFVAFAMMPKGKRGEALVALITKMKLKGKDYIAINNVTLKTPRGTTQIDHVIVSKYGVFAIETKTMNGWIFGNEEDERWTQMFSKNSKYTFQNPLRQNYSHTKALEQFLSINHNKIHSVIAFMGKAEFKTPMPSNVVKKSQYIPYIKSKTEILFTDQEVARMVKTIRTGMMPQSAKVNREHIEALRKRHGRS